MVEVLRADASHGEGFLPGFARSLAEGQIVHLGDRHVLAPLPRSPDIYWLLDAALSAIRTREHYSATGIGHQTNIQQIEGIAYRPRFEHILNGEGVAEAGFGV